MQLRDLVRPIEELSDEELLERVRTIRHNRERARPVAKKKAERTAKKASNAKVGKLDRAIDKLSPAEKEALLKQLLKEGD